jgi:hypothetical protein
VSDGYRNARVHRFSSDGQLKASWGQPGKTSASEFHLPHSLLIDQDERVIVCDRENHRIQIFDLNGEFITMWTDIQRPMDISVDSDGVFCVSEGSVDDSSARISLLDKDGAVLSRFECRGSGHGSWMDSRGDIYLAGVPDAIDKFVRQS